MTTVHEYSLCGFLQMNESLLLLLFYVVFQVKLCCLQLKKKKLALKDLSWSLRKQPFNKADPVKTLQWLNRESFNALHVLFNIPGKIGTEG